MKISNMQSANGNDVPNQFIIEHEGVRWFQSYDSIIAKDGGKQIVLDEKYWDYSVTTGKYRNQFLGEAKKETQRKIKEGIYLLADLNTEKFK